jgi:hypothetical protein
MLKMKSTRRVGGPKAKRKRIKAAPPSGPPKGGTQSAAPTPAVAARGIVQKTYVPVRVLSGFMDAPHLNSVIGEYLQTLDPTARAQADADVDVARAWVRALPPFQPTGAVGRAIAGTYVDLIRADKVFQETFAQRTYRFRYVELGQLVALQPWIEPRSDPIPGDEQKLLEFALPNMWDVPAEVSFVAPTGPIQILTSSPAMQGLRLEFEQSTGTVKLGPPKHANLVQVVHFAGRHYLINGYHRVADAIASGLSEFPALILEATGPQEIQLPGIGPFNAAYVAGMARPPLVSDFHSAAATRSKVRERRYGVLVELQVKPLIIGI